MDSSATQLGSLRAVNVMHEEERLWDVISLLRLLINKPVAEPCCVNAKQATRSGRQPPHNSRSNGKRGLTAYNISRRTKIRPNLQALT